MDKSKKKFPPHERSFTLVETMVAMAIMAAIILEFGSMQGNVIYFSEYLRNSSKAIYYAKQVMSQVEYFHHTREFSELSHDSEKEYPLDSEGEFSYVLKIVEWKLPILDFLGGGGLAGEGEAQSEGGSNAMKGTLESVLGKDLLRVAHVEVGWAEGAKRNSVSLTLLLTNQAKVDETLATFIGDYEKLLKEENGTTDKPVSTPTTPNVPGDGDEE